MWLLNFIPDAVIVLAIHLTTAVGLLSLILGSVAGFIPWLKAQAGLLKIVGVIILLIGVYFQGGIGVELSWRERARALEEQIAAAEQKSGESNVIVQTKYLDRVKVVKQTQEVMVEKIREVEKLVDAKCDVAPEAIIILNEAAQDPRSKP
jgi:thiol:disulfide interchange protein